MRNSQQISNKEFLELYSDESDSLSKFLLPHERDAVEKSVEKQKNAFREVIEQKKSVTGGDDWHDGAFTATDNEAKIIGQQMSALSPFIGAIVVDYPEPEESRASIGSRVVINQNGYSFAVDVVGFISGYPDKVISDEFEDEIMGISPESPIAKVIIGKEQGFEGEFYNSGNVIQVKIERIDQSAIKNYFLNEVQLFEVEE